MLIQGPFSLSLHQEFCRIYAQFFPFGDPEPLASLVFRGFGAGGGGGGGVELWGSPSLSRHSLLQLEALLKRDWHVSCGAVNYQMLC